MARTRLEERQYIPPYVRLQVLNECKRICVHCGTRLVPGGNFTLEHVIPLNKGGKNEIDNYVALCLDCNQAKSDDIVDPREYYPYLQEPKRSVILKTFDDYIQAVDYLSYDNLFKTDQFDLLTHIPVFKKNGIVNMPINVRVEKVNRNKAFEFLTMYKARLSTEDKDLIVCDARQITMPYYQISYKGDILMFCSIYIYQQVIIKGEYPELVLYIDLYSHYDIRQRRHTIGLYYNILHDLLCTANDVFLKDKQISAIKTIIRTPCSDKIMHSVILDLDRLEGDHWSVGKAYDNPDKIGSCVLTATAAIINGSKQDIKRIMDRQGIANVYDFAEKVNMISLQTHLENRLQNATMIKEAKDPYANRVKPSDKKRKNSKSKKR